MSKKGLIDLTIVILFILGAAIFIVPEISNDLQVSHFVNLSVSLNAASYCSKLSETKYRQECYLKVALALKNSSVCENLPFDSGGCAGFGACELIGGCPGISFRGCEEVYFDRKECKNQVLSPLIDLSIKNKDYSFCEKNNECIYSVLMQLNDSENCGIGGVSRDECLTALSIKGKNYTLCSKMNDSNWEIDCYNAIYPLIIDPRICNFVALENKGVCYLKTALNLTDPELCLFSNEKKNECNYFFADYFNDISYCEKMNSSHDDCSYYVINKTNDPKLCSKTGSNSDACFFSYSRRNNDSSLCGFAGKLKEECYYSLMYAFNDSKYCGFVSKPGECFYLIAKASNNTQLCLKSGDFSQQCFYHFIKLTGDPTLCYQINESTGNRCYWAYNKNPNQCNPGDFECLKQSGIYNMNITTCLKSNDLMHECFYGIAEKQNRLQQCTDKQIEAVECIKILFNITLG